MTGYRWKTPLVHAIKVRVYDGWLPSGGSEPQRKQVLHVHVAPGDLAAFVQFIRDRVEGAYITITDDEGEVVV